MQTATDDDGAAGGKGERGTNTQKQTPINDNIDRQAEAATSTTMMQAKMLIKYCNNVITLKWKEAAEWGPISRSNNDNHYEEEAEKNTERKRGRER